MYPYSLVSALIIRKLYFSMDSFPTRVTIVNMRTYNFFPLSISTNKYSLHVVHAYHHSKGHDRANKIKDAVFAVGSPIIASALSTMGASAFLFGCRTWVFIELGLLICSITAMALVYTMTFLLAWLACAGPVPIFENDQNNVHQWDLKALCCASRLRRQAKRPTAVTEMDQSDDSRSVFSIEIVGDLDTDFTDPPKPETILTPQRGERKQLENGDIDRGYDIEIVDDDEAELVARNTPQRVPKEEEQEETLLVVNRPSVRSMLSSSPKIVATQVPVTRFV